MTLAQRLTSAPLFLLGEIKCRFSETSKQMKGLGDFLKSYFREESQPIFYLERDYRWRDEAKAVSEARRHTMIVIKETTIDEMRERGVFSLPLDEITLSSTITTIRLSLRLQLHMTYSNGDKHLSISGSPQILDAEKLMEATGERSG